MITVLADEVFGYIFESDDKEGAVTIWELDDVHIPLIAHAFNISEDTIREAIKGYERNRH